MLVRNTPTPTTGGHTLPFFAALAVGMGASAQTPAWYPSKWGASDEIGAANYMTPALALAAARLVKTGKVYSLGITVSTTTPAYPPRTCSIYIVQPGQTGSANGLGPTNTTYNDDILNCWTGIGTQLDGLGHIGVGDRYYNGNKWGEFADISGLKKLGVEKLPPMVARGVLLDMAGFLGVDVVKEGTPFNRAEIDGAARKQGVEIRQGDVVIFHTGWLSLIDKDPKRFGSAEPARGRATWSRRASSPWVPTLGRSRRFRSSRAPASSRSTRSCCR